MPVDLSPVVVAVVLGMSLVTYATKAGGLWLLGGVELSPPARAGLEALPGGIIVAILAPRLLRGGLPEWCAAVAVLAVAHRTDSVLLSLAVGVAAVLVLRGVL